MESFESRNQNAGNPNLVLIEKVETKSQDFRFWLVRKVVVLPAILLVVTGADKERQRKSQVAKGALMPS